MAKLLTDAALREYMLVNETDAMGDNPVDTLEARAFRVRDAVESLLEAETNQIFGPQATVSDELLDGTGTSTIYSTRPILTLSSMEFLNHVGAGDVEEWYDAYTGLAYTVQGRRIVLRNSRFPCQPLSVRIGYTAKANQPERGIQAVAEATAYILRSIGSEDARSEQIGTFQHVLKRSLKELPSWQLNVENLLIPMLG